MFFPFKKTRISHAFLLLSKIHLTQFSEGGPGKYLALATSEGSLDDVMNFSGLHMDKGFFQGLFSVH